MEAMVQSHWLEIAPAGGVTVVRFHLPRLIETRVVQALGEQLAHQADQLGRRRFVLNLQGVAAVSSALLGKLVRFQDQVTAAGGRVVLCGLEPDVHDVLRTTSLTELLPVYPDEPQAVRSC